MLLFSQTTEGQGDHPPGQWAFDRRKDGSGGTSFMHLEVGAGWRRRYPSSGLVLLPSSWRMPSTWASAVLLAPRTPESAEEFSRPSLNQRAGPR